MDKTAKRATKLITMVNRRLSEGRTWDEISSEVGVPLGTLYAKIRRMGYKTGKRLVPIHAPELTENSTRD